MHQLILASQSARRRHILKEQGYEFSVHPLELSEILKKNLTPIEQIRDLALQKAKAAVAELNSLKGQDILVLAADTVVLFEGQILGKPKNFQDAVQMLSQMSGKEHEVITAFCLWDLGRDCFVLEHDISKVCFRPLQKQEIIEYVESGEPMDKAGAYGIQGQGGKLVDRYEGSFQNIVGLPIEKLKEVLDKNGWSIRKKS
ncbi:MAG: septum formation protein Maf [Bdellovibrionales bacterium]|nr:septum formation protein Maf [Bdellovibrionales bacterium]